MAPPPNHFVDATDPLLSRDLDRTLSGAALCGSGSDENLPSRQRLGDHLAGDIGQAEIAAEVAVGQAGVIESEQMQNRGV